MKKNIFIFHVFCFLTAGIGAQDFGIAVQDQMTAPLVNPAAMGVGNSAGISYIQEYTEDKLVKDFDLLFSLGGLAYSYQRNEDFSTHYIAGGFEIGQGLYSGASFSWAGKGNQDSRLGFSLLYRPLPFLSLASKGENLNHDPYTEIGIGVRPLISNAPIMTRLTLSGDARIDDDGYTTMSLGAFFEPFNGLKIFGDYNLEEDVLELGVSLALSYLEIGSTQAVSEDSFDGGRYHVYSSFKKQRSVWEPVIRKAVEYDMAGIILDAPQTDSLSGIGQDGTRSLMDFIQDMEKIKNDPATEALIFRNQEFLTTFANMLEIESLLQEVKDSGKKIYFYYDSVQNIPYALAASVADGIYLNPAGTVNLKGFSSSRVYLKDFLADWGIRFQNFQSHPYKTAYNFLSESDMTPEERESLEYFYAGLHRELTRMLENRAEKLSMGVSDAIDRGPYIYADTALDIGLVDGLLYEDEFNDFLQKEKLNLFRMSLSLGEMEYQWEGTRPTIALIYASGLIHGGTGIAGQTIGSDSLVEAIRKARKNPAVKAIVLRVNSGGGSSLASDMIAREVALCRIGDNPKPVIVSMGGTAASGGYYISAPAEKIVASPGSVTGSIGVIAGVPDISGLLEMFHVGSETVKTSETADAGNILRSMPPEEQERLTNYIGDLYNRFITIVGEYREMPVSEVNKQAQGRIWTGTQAMERGLVDETGGLSQALLLARDLIHSNDGIRIVEMVPGRRKGLLESAIPFLTGGSMLSRELPLPEDLENLIQFYENLNQFEDGEALYLMPYAPEELGITP